MSLFDVIRFPITDIYDLTQIEPLPVLIKLRWTEEIVRFSYKGIKFSHHHFDYWKEVHKHLSWAAHENQKEGKHSVMHRVTLTKAYKDIFTYKLKQMIADYGE